MSKKYLICSLAVLSFLATNVDAYQREGCGGGGCNSGCRAPTSSYQGYQDPNGPYYDHRGPDVAPLHRDNRPQQSPGARVPDNKRFTQFQGELPTTPSTGNGHHWFNPATVSMFKGDVVSVTRIDGPNGGQLVRIVFRTNQGDDVELRTAPSNFFEEKKFALRQGDKIDVKGSKTNWNGRTIIIAQEIRKDGETIVLRDKDGKPTWKESPEEIRDREQAEKENNDKKDTRSFNTNSQSFNSQNLNKQGYGNPPNPNSNSFDGSRDYNSSSTNYITPPQGYNNSNRNYNQGYTLESNRGYNSTTNSYSNPYSTQGYSNLNRNYNQGYNLESNRGYNGTTNSYSNPSYSTHSYNNQGYSNGYDGSLNGYSNVNPNSYYYEF